MDGVHYIMHRRNDRHKRIELLADCWSSVRGHCCSGGLVIAAAAVS